MIKICEGPECGVKFETQRPNARFHSATCRKRANRRTDNVVPISKAVADAGPPGELETALRLELRAADREQSSLGVAAIQAAKRIDRGAETGAGLAALLRQYIASRAVALEDASEEEDEVAKIRASAAMKLLEGGRAS